MRKKGVRPLLLREPGGTAVGEAIRQVLLHLRVKAMAPQTELMLYLAARAQIVQEKILPGLKRGRTVICDRFEDSTLAYQGFGRGLSVKEIEHASRVVRGSLKPKLTFLLDIDPAAGFKRIKRGHDRMESAPLAFHRRVRRGFLALARREPKRFRVLDARKSPEAVFKKISEALDYAL